MPTDVVGGFKALKRGGDVARRFTDKERKAIIADYIECENFSAVARKHGCSPSGVKKIVLSDPESVGKCDIKKEQNTEDILAHMEEKKKDVCDVIDVLLEAMKDEEKIGRANIQQVATALGIVIDKFTERSEANDNGMLEELIKGLKD